MPKKTFESITKSRNNYVVKVKQNQRGLYNAIHQIRQGTKALDNFITKEKNRGRKEKRTIKTYKVSEYIRKNWRGAKTVVHIVRERKTKKGKAITHSYYISSLSERAKEFAKGIRNHWGIENRLHYVKDVTLKEDESKIKSGNAPEILSLVRNLTINIARMNGENRIRKFTRQCAGNIMLIASLLE